MLLIFVALIMHILYSTALNVILGLNYNTIKGSDHKSFDRSWYLTNENIAERMHM